MKLVVDRFELLNALGRVQGAVASKPSNPALSHVLIQALDGRVIVTATDLSIATCTSLEAVILEEGGIALPWRKLTQLVREMTSPQVKISTAPSYMAEVTAGTSLFKIHGMGEKEFPEFPDLSHFTKFRVSIPELKKALVRTSFSVAREDSRHLLNGLSLRLEGESITFIGTDGKRLAKTLLPLAEEKGLEGSHIVPIKSVEEMIKVLGGDQGTAQVSLSREKLALECEGQILVTKLLLGQYPDVEKVIPQEVKTEILLHREELIVLLRQISLFCPEPGGSVRFAFDTAQLSLRALSAEVGEGQVSMPVDYSGPRLEIAFNPFFLLDILRHMEDEVVCLGLTNAHNPGKLTDRSSSQYIIMPMRLQELEQEASTVVTGL